jgi:hypothetical protein
MGSPARLGGGQPAHGPVARRGGRGGLMWDAAQSVSDPAHGGDALPRVKGGLGR